MPCSVSTALAIPSAWTPKATTMSAERPCAQSQAPRTSARSRSPCQRQRRCHMMQITATCWRRSHRRPIAPGRGGKQRGPCGHTSRRCLKASHNQQQLTRRANEHQHHNADPISATPSTAKTQNLVEKMRNPSLWLWAALEPKWLEPKWLRKIVITI